ncbi:MAG: MCE family protein [Sedimentisphaerales bacterium]|nr:MCE family protein [Sedimentisphaerales bacterium]
MNDYDCIQNRRNMIVGAFVVIGVVIFAYMVFLFGELPVVMTKFTSYEIRVKFPFAPGVEQNTPVRYCGYQVGRVTYVAPPIPSEDEDGRFIHQVMVTIAISRDYATIPSNVEVKLFRRGMGSSYIELDTIPMLAKDFDKLDPKFLKDGMELQGQSGAASEILPAELQDKMETFFAKITKLVDNTDAIIGDPENRENLKTSLANVSKVSEEAVATMEQIKELSATANQRIAKVSDSVLQTSEELGETLIEMRRVINKINNGQGTVGKLINDDKLYQNLIDSSEELKASLENMKKTLKKTSEKGIQVKVF